MSGQTVYTDPKTPGAPQPGDVVVVVREYHPNHRAGPWTGVISVLDAVSETAEHYPWQVRSPRNTQWCEPVYSVRHPTPAELATYHLQVLT